MLTMASDQMLQQVTLLYLKASRLSYILFQTSFFILLLLFYFSCSNSNSSQLLFFQPQNSFFIEGFKQRKSYRSFLSLVKSTLLGQVIRSQGIYHGNTRVSRFQKSDCDQVGRGTAPSDYYETQVYCQQTGKWIINILFLECFVQQPWLNICNSDFMHSRKVLNLRSIYQKVLVYFVLPLR